MDSLAAADPPTGETVAPLFANTPVASSLRAYLSAPARLRYIIAGFMREAGLQSILPTGDAVLLTSWRPDYLLSGGASLAIYPLAKQHGWTLYVNDAVHAKFYSRDLASAWIGSANCTGRGLGLRSDSNHEAMAFSPELSPPARIWVHGLLARSRLVDDELFSWYQDRHEAAQRGAAGETQEEEPPIVDSFLLNQLPASDSPARLWSLLKDPSGASSDWDEISAAEHDVGLYRVSPTCRSRDDLFDALRPAVFTHPFVRALIGQIPPEGARFGAVKAWVQGICTDVPVPYRRELTPHVQSLYKWLTQLAPECFEVTRPRHSEILWKHADPPTERSPC